MLGAGSLTFGLLSLRILKLLCVDPIVLAMNMLEKGESREEFGFEVYVVISDQRVSYCGDKSLIRSLPIFGIGPQLVTLQIM